MSSDREQDYFADGMTEDLITALSRVRELSVISRNSSFAYRGRAVRLEDVTQELGVRFILEGSIRVASSRVRVTAQLIDGHSGDHVWAERFDGSLDDIFGVQDEITQSIALALQVKLTDGEQARLWDGQTRNLRAWEKMVLARDLFLRFNAIDNREARRALEAALGFDPNYTGAMVLLGMTYWWDARFNDLIDREYCLRLAEQQVEKVLSLNPEAGNAHMVRGNIAYLRDLHDEAIRHCQNAINMAPSDSWAHAALGQIYVYAGEGERALAAVKTAMRLSPHYPPWYTYYSALANLWAGNLDAARDAAEAYLQQEPEPFGYICLATVYGFQERVDDATRAITELRKRFPAFRIADFAPSQHYKEPGRLDRVVGILRRAGMPD
jgi:TolB-like protein